MTASPESWRAGWIKVHPVLYVAYCAVAVVGIAGALAATGTPTYSDPAWQWVLLEVALLVALTTGNRLVLVVLLVRNTGAFALGASELADRATAGGWMFLLATGICQLLVFAIYLTPRPAEV